MPSESGDGKELFDYYVKSEGREGVIDNDTTHVSARAWGMQRLVV